ncbi:hypothetical protein BGZ65_008385, partial [Modicella reniformis]
MEFPSIKEFKLCYFSDDVENFVPKFMQRCPNLTSFWVDGPDNLDLISSFSELVAARTWTHLHSISIESYKITSDTLSEIIGSMQQITALDISHEHDFFASNIMELLRPHFSSIRILHLRSNIGMISPMAQEILSSCPLLERLTAPPIDASVVEVGKPWVCTRLQELRLMFVYKEVTYKVPTLPRLQPLVFDQMAKLVRLEEWYTGYPSRKIPHQRLDLTLRNGLSKLSTLRSLRSIDLDNTKQEIGQQEIDWILQHWTDLETING